MAAQIRRDKGAGSVFQRSRDGRWVATVELPLKADGRRARKTFTGDTKAEVTKRARDFERELLKHGYNPEANIRMSDWLTGWLENTRRTGQLAPRTIDGYRGYIDRYLTPSLGRIYLAKLTPTHVDRLVTWMTTELELSPTTALQALNILKASLKDAMKRGLVDRNVAALVRAPAKAHHEADVLTLEQALAVLRWAWAQDPVTSARISLALLTGLRQAEALGLRRDHVDLERGYIVVEWQLQSLKTPPPKSRRHIALGGAAYLTEPKSQAGARVVPVIEPLRLALERRLLEMPDDPAAFVVTGPRGGHSEATKDNKAWRAALDAAGVPRVRLHDARHTVATLLRAAGVDADVIQSIMGHSSALMTKHYQHLMEGDAAREMGKFARMIEGSRGSR